MKAVFFSVFFLSFAIHSSDSFEIKHLKKEDTAELEQVYELFDNEDVVKKTSYNSCDIVRIIEENKKGVFIAQDRTTKVPTIVAALFVSCLPKKLTSWTNRPSWDDMMDKREEIDDEISCDIVAVHPNFNNRETISNLINYLENKAQELHVSCLTTSAYDDDKSAIECYERRQFLCSSKAFGLRVYKKEILLNR